MDAISVQFAPATGSAEEWNEAYARLADYFRSHRLHHRLRRTQLILQTLQEASEVHKAEPWRKPTEVAIDQARQQMKAWLGKVYEDMPLKSDQVEAAGRLSFHLCNGPERWPMAFLDAEQVPAAMAEAMHNVVRNSGPGLQISKMTPRAIDLGLTEVADDTFEGLERHPYLRYAFLALVVAGVLGYVYHTLYGQ